jgi:hypothetical protein
MGRTEEAEADRRVMIKIPLACVLLSDRKSERH